MGFTFSHPALILPFRYLPRKFYSLTGLITGSMIPDLEYFIRWDTRSDYSHTFKGIFWFDLPCALFCMFIFHNIIRDVFISNIPAKLKSKLIRFQNFNWSGYFKKNWLVVVYSTLIGIITHLFWDAFTSYDGFFVQRSSFLMSSFDLFFFKTRNYRMLKYGSSIIGLMIIIYQFQHLKSNLTTLTLTNNYWVLIALISIPLSVVRIYRTDPDDSSLNSVLKISISSLILGLMVSSFYHKKRRESKKQDAFSKDEQKR